LIPIWQLDGGRGFNALDRRERFIAAGLVAAGWLLSGDTMFVLVLLGAGYRIFFTPAAGEPGRRALFTYGALIVGITLLSQIQVIELERPRSQASSSRT
jgi:Zn-dependent protease